MAQPTTWVVFVRAVMHGRDGYDAPTVMAAMRTAGAGDVTSHLTTGNITFVANADAVDDVLGAAEDAIARSMTGDHRLYVRSLDELTALLQSDVFAAAPFVSDEQLVTFARNRLPASLELPIVSPRGDSVTFAVSDRELFSVVRDVDGRRSAPGGRLERHLGVSLTTRGLRTVQRIVRRCS